MKNTVTRLFLATTLVVTMISQAGVAFAGDATAGDVFYQSVMLPFRIGTGVAGGAFGAANGGINGVIDMEKRVFESQGRNSEDGYLESNFMTWPVDVVQGAVVAPFGFLTGMPKGFASGFNSGWHFFQGDE